MGSNLPESVLSALMFCIGINYDCRIQLETRIVLQLETATLHDLLLPGKKEKESKCVLKNELESMERILRLFLTRIQAFDEAKAVDMATLPAIAKLWDQYLTEIAFDTSIAPARFADLIERVPAHVRTVHDHVYSAIHAYLKVSSLRLLPPQSTHFCVFLRRGSFHFMTGIKLLPSFSPIKEVIEDFGAQPAEHLLQEMNFN